jgi:hypothetical protein
LSRSTKDEREETPDLETLGHELHECRYCLRAFLPELFERREAEAIAAARQGKAKTRAEDWRKGNKWGCKFKAIRKESSDSQNACPSLPHSKEFRTLFFLLP